jgi:acetolactate synthase-1/2/3 large subunit
MKKTGGMIFTESLIRNGVTDLFMIPGIQLDWAVDALRQKGDEIKLYVPRHEQTTTYMADGYFRASGKVGTAMVVPGPGALNAGAGLSTAYASNSKVMFLTGQICSKGIGKGYGLLHEIKDQSGFVAGLTKWNTMVKKGEHIAKAVDEAFTQINQGRPRPVGVEVPHDFLSESYDLPEVTRTESSQAHKELNQTLVDDAAALINHAKLPVIYAGGGALSAATRAGLQALAEKIGAPVVMSDNGRGAISDRHPLAMNSLAGRAVFEYADVVIVLGSRFMDVLSPETSWPMDKAKFIFVNIDAADMTSPRTPSVAIEADVAQVLPTLVNQVKARKALTNDQALSVKEWASQQIEQIQPQASYVAQLRNSMPDDAIFVNELTQIGYLARIAFPVYEPHTYIGPGYQGTLGYGFPVALGAAVGGNGRRVVSITGDGGFGWNLQELATANRYNLPITLIVFNDGHYGNVRAIQKRQFGAEVAVELANPDFGLLAQSFGVDFISVDNPEDLGRAVSESITADGPLMIEVKVGVMPSPWHLLRLQPLGGVVAPNTPANPLRAAFS